MCHLVQIICLPNCNLKICAIILPENLYACETWSLKLREDTGKRVPEQGAEKDLQV